LAGFFGFFDYNKPGKGVDVNAPPKKPFFRFWELYWRKFSRFIVLNMLAFVFLLPLITVIFLFYVNWLDSIGVLAMMFPEEELAEGGAIFFGILFNMLVNISHSVPPQLALVLLVLSAVCYGPVMCGMTYVLRNYAREEHAWISDFFQRMKSNFRQGVVLGLLEIFALTTLFFNITAQTEDGTAAWLDASLPVIRYISIFLIVLILFARQYIYAMAVTFNLRLIGILKNAFAFAFLGLFRNTGVVLCSGVLLLTAMFVRFADVILLPFFFFSFTGFLTMFACFPLIHKHMILPVQTAEAGETDEDDEEPV
jgi:uncharacterized membrane protein YesL